MAGKSGGSWKVAYADFVTAMMAFFLVMWLGSQDEKIKQSVANYFIDPSGTSKKPVDNGAVLQAKTFGGVPKESEVAMAMGRHRQTAPGERTPETKLLTNYVVKDSQRKAYWNQQAKRMEDEAERTKEVREGVQTKDHMAAFLLAKQLEEEMGRTAGGRGDNLQAELLNHSLNGVNWQQLAEDLLDTAR